MAFNIYTFSDSVRNLVNKNNTITSDYDISEGLSKRIRKVFLGYHEKKPIINELYPAVWVAPKTKNEDFDSLGNASAKRDMTLQFEVTGIVQQGLGEIDGREVSDEQMMKLSANLDTLFRNYIRLSNTSSVVSSLVETTEYDVIESEDTWNSITKLNLNIKVRSD